MRILKKLDLLESRMFALIPVLAEAGMHAFDEHLACVVCFVPLIVVKLELN